MSYDPFKIMSSNIRFDTPRDEERAWPHRKDILFQSILDFSPAILGTQEGREPQLRELEDGIQKYKLIDHHRPWIEERMYPSLFIDQQQFDVLESGDIWLSETPDVPGSKSFESMFPRLCTWVRGVYKNSKKEVFAANVHLDHVQDMTRFEQIQVLSQQLKKLMGEKDALVLMGDFNESPDGQVRQHLNSALPELYDPWILLKKTEESSHHTFKQPITEGARIDWILAHKSLEAFDIFLDKREKEGLYPSDHFPVKGLFKP